MEKAKYRALFEIAKDIKRHWKDINFGAVAYLHAMETMTTIQEDYVEDSGESIVLYFLANASTFRGENARRLKAELNAMLK